MDYFVDSLEGNDRNSGTSPSAPWKSIAKVNSFFSQDQSGNQICFRSGRGWKEQLDFNGNAIFGKDGAPFVITSYGDGSLPSISGADKVTGWELFTGNIWGKSGFTEIQDTYYKSARIRKSSSLESMEENRAFYDTQSGTLYIWLSNNENPNNVGVLVTSRNYGIRLRTTSGHIIIENIYANRHRHDAISVYVHQNIGTSNITIQNCHAAFAGVDGPHGVDSSDGIVVYGPRPDHRMRNLRIINNYSHHNLNCAVEIGSQDGAYIAGNRLEYCSNGLELWQECSNCIFERNAVAHMNNDKQQNRNLKEAGAWVHAFDGGESTNNLFRQNVFLNCKKGIQVWTGSAEIEQNTFVDARLIAIDIKNTDNSEINAQNNMLVVNRIDNKGIGVFIRATNLVNYIGNNNSFYSPNSKAEDVKFQIDNTVMDFEQWKLFMGQDANSFQAVAVQPSETPVDGVVASGAWWVVK